MYGTFFKRYAASELLIILNTAVGVDEEEQGVEMIRFEGGAGFIDR